MTCPQQHPDQWADEPTTDLERLMAEPPGGSVTPAARRADRIADRDWLGHLDASLDRGKCLAAMCAGVPIDDEVAELLERRIHTERLESVHDLLTWLAVSHTEADLVVAQQHATSPAAVRGLGYVHMAHSIDRELTDARWSVFLALRATSIVEWASATDQAWTDVACAAAQLATSPTD